MRDAADNFTLERPEQFPRIGHDYVAIADAPAHSDLTFAELVPIALSVLPSTKANLREIMQSVTVQLQIA